MRLARRLAPLFLTALLWASPQPAISGVGGVGGVWTWARGDFYGWSQPGTNAGLIAADAAANPTGHTVLNPGTEGLTLPAYRAGRCWIWQRYDGYRIIGTPFEAWPGGVRQLRVDSLGVRAESVLTTPRLGPYSASTTGGAIRIVDGVKFPLTGAGIQAANNDLPTAGGIVVIPTGIFTTGVPLKIKNNVVWHMTGRGASVIQATVGFSGTALVMNADTTGGQQWCAIENGTLDGNASGGAVVPRVLLMKGIGQPSRIRDMTVINGSGVGIWREGLSFNIGNFEILNSGVANMGHHCWYLGGATGATSMIDCDAENPGGGGDAVFLDGPTPSSAYASSIVISLLHVEQLSAGEVGLHIDGVRGVSANGIAYYGSGGVGDLVKITGSASDCKNITLSNVSSSVGSTANVIVDNVFGRTFSGNGDVAFYSTDKVHAATFVAYDSSRVNGPSKLIGDITGGTPGATFTATFGQGTTGTDNADVFIRSGNGSGAKARLLLERNTSVDLDFQVLGTAERVEFRNAWVWGTTAGGTVGGITTTGKFRFGDGGTATHSVEAASDIFAPDSARFNKGLYLGGQFVSKVDGNTGTLNFGAPGAVPGAVDLTLTVTGAAFGDQPLVGAPVTVGANYTLTAFVSAANTVTVRWYQHSGAAADPDGAGGTYTVRFLR